MFNTYRNRKMRTRRRFFVVEARPYTPLDDLDGVDLRGLRPEHGDMIVRNRDEHAQMWLIARRDFDATWEMMP